MNHNEFMQIFRKLLANNDDFKYFIQGVADGCNNEYKGLLKQILDIKINEYISELKPLPVLYKKINKLLDVLCPKMPLDQRDSIIQYAHSLQEVKFFGETYNEIFIEKGV